MSAIYQRARPIHWDEVVGQEHVKDVLRAALERGRVGHAYLFSGPRGVGKTTTARLIAMTANCERDGKKPCGECPSCLAVRAGSHPDVLEIDAASNNSVDDVRELREKVSLSAMRGGKKIYILDEAHMMSRAAFNALLKTLEEPPSHVIFVLATTEPEKILPTILSRCQHYRFRRLSDAEIAGKLALICSREGVQAEEAALHLIGRLADGAMRDGESLLERMLAAGEAVTRVGVEAALGLPPSERVASMARALALGDAEPLLSGAGQLYREGYAARTVVEGLKTALRDALHAELGLGNGARLEGAEVPRLLRLQAALDEQEARFSRGADLLALELALTHALLAGDGPATGGGGASVGGDVGARLAKIERDLAALKSAPRPAAGPGAAEPEVPDFDPGARGPRPAVGSGSSAPPRPASAPPQSAPQGSWPDVLRLADIKLRALLKVARANTVATGALVVTYEDRYRFHAKQVLDQFDDLAALVTRVYGPVEVELVTPEGSKKKSGRSAAGELSAPSTQSAAPERLGTSLGAAAREAVRQVAPSGPPSAPAPAQEVPDFSPTRARSAAPAPAVAVLAPQSAEPEPAPRQAAPTPPPSADSGGAAAAPSPREVYDPQPVFQEPDWDDAPPRAAPTVVGPSRASPPTTPPLPTPIETPWEGLGAAPSTPGPAPSDPASVAPPRGAAAQVREANVTLRAHPLFQEATRLFAGKVKESGVLKRAKPSPTEGEDAEGDAAETDAADETLGSERA